MSEQNNLRTIEIDGVKLQVDLRTAVRIDILKVGSRIKILKKSDYGSPSVYHGVVVGFEPFKTLPTIIIAYMETDYSSSDLKFCYYNKQTATKGTLEVVAALDDDHLGFEKDEVLKKIDSKIQKQEQELQDLKDRRQYFLDKFNTWWTPTVAVDSDVEDQSPD